MWSRVEMWLARWPSAFFFTLSLAWMLLIFCLSAQPTLPHAPDPLADVLLKKGSHMAAYGVLLLLWWKALTTHWSFREPFSPLALAWLIVLAYAASDEFHQTHVPGRNGTAVDVIVDGTGATLAVLAIWLANRRRVP